MIFDNKQPQEIYELIAEWLCSKSFGGHTCKSTFKYFHKNLWNPILVYIKYLKYKDNLSEEEREFLDTVVYNGDIFRVLRYYPRDKKYVYEMNEYQSWSKSLNGLKEIPGLQGDYLLIIGKSDVGINVFELLCFLIKNKYIVNPNGLKSFERIARYELEEEITYKVSFDNIHRIVAINSKDLLEYDDNIIREIDRKLWGRNNFR